MQRAGEPGSRTLYFSWAADGKGHAALEITRLGEVP